ncbi:MAG: hypothetical protein E6H04_04705 [Bacillati bacterium ANGP1]|uniref:Guanylate cyclase domain-containing protein n=1 Tax=Candidatus Segetimicrobium genomatis TaxID=2569760 RepID=A0A537JG43_9BACT|nr:MAG: hypothetical protein E6H04_04705 [Terrabacteria group bacterium ANGP1]
MIVCPRCGKENPPAARFCMGCAAKLSQGCAVCGADNPLGTHFCLRCGAPLAPAATAERRVVSILFADIVGSTSLAARLDPEQVRAIIGEYFLAMREEVAQYGGTVEKFVGDAIMAVFGLPQAHEDDPERAVRTAAAMQRRIVSLRAKLEDLHIRIGISTGEVIADPQAVRSRELMVTGEIVNLAARLQQQAPPDTIVVDERTHAAIKAIARVEPLPAAGAGDFPDRPRWRVLELVDRPAAKWLSAPLLGRADEVQLLVTLYRRTVENRKHQLITLIGAAGVGKSRLAEEVLSVLGRGPTPPNVLRGRCPAYGEGLTYWPLAEMLKQECRILDSDPPAVVTEKLHAGIHPVRFPALGAEDVHTILGGLGTILGRKLADQRAGFPDPRDAGDPRSSGASLLQSLKAFLLAKAHSQPLVLLFEDLHWGEESLLELIEHFAIRGADAPIFILCLARPELLERRPEWGARIRNYTAISISALSLEHSRLLMAELLDGEAVPTDVREAILTKAEGNPFFIEEILRMLIDGGSLVRAEGGWRWTAYPLEIRLPDTIHGILASRLDLLPPLEKRVIQDASVAGRIFWFGTLTAAGLHAAEAAAALERLQERDLVEELTGSTLAGEREFAFKHALIPDVAYSTLPKAARSIKHLGFAEWLERTAQHNDEFLELLAHHYEHAWQYKFETGERAEPIARKAIQAIRNAGARATALGTLPEARRLYERGLEILYTAGLEKDTPLFLELLTDRTEVVKWLLSPDVVFSDTQTVVQLAPTIGRQDLLARAFLNRAFAEFDRGRLLPAEDALRHAERLFRTLDDGQGEAEALEMLGVITEDLRGKLTTAGKAYRQTLDLYRTMGNAQGVARTLARLGRCLLNAGRLDEAAGVLAEARAVANDGDALVSLGILAHLRGHSSDAIRWYRDAISACLRRGDLLGSAHAHRHLAFHYLRLRQPDEAERAFQRARALRSEHGAKSESPGILRGLAEVYLARGDLLRAAEYGEQGFSAVADHDRITRATHGATLARVRASQGRGDEAEALFHGSMQVLEAGEYVIDLALTLLKHGEALLVLGRPEPARPLLERARGLFAEMGATFFVNEVDARLQTALSSR